jgi:hypothetical protein
LILTKSAFKSKVLLNQQRFQIQSTLTSTRLHYLHLDPLKQ